MVTIHFILLMTFIDAYCRWLSDEWALILVLSLMIFHWLLVNIILANFTSCHLIWLTPQLHVKEHFLLRNWSKILKQLNIESKLDLNSPDHQQLLIFDSGHVKWIQFLTVKPGLLTSHRYATVKCFAEGDINGNAEMAYPFKKADVNRSTFSGRTYFM